MPGTISRPNFLIIVADDLGFSDLGCFGSEISTPNLDALAADGCRLTGHHTASACSPTRSMLMSGTDNHLAGLGQMAETVRTNSVFKGAPGYEGMLNQRVAALPEILRDNGYSTYMSGKWHLGMTPDSVPAARGFDRVFALLPGGGNHYGYEPTLEDGSPAVAVLPPIYMENDAFISHTTLPKDYYSTQYFTDRMLGYLEDHVDTDPTKPFFAYLPYTAPHWPLQAPEDVIKKYEGRYDAGPHALRQSRLASMKKLGIISEDTRAAQVRLMAGDKDWEEMAPDERAGSSRRMEVYAAMIEVMDAHIGRVVEHLKATGQYDNTLIFFGSDNGAEGALLEALPIFGLDFEKSLKRFFDNSLSNIGRANSFCSIGASWAQAATAPNAMYKAWSTEGGIRCPAVVRFPWSHLGKSGAVLPSFNTVMDILPTCLQLAGIQHPAPNFQGRKVLSPRGRSLCDWLSGRADLAHDADEIHGWELFGQAAVRRGKYKALFIPDAGAEWQLYDLENDAGETTDLAKTHPEQLAMMLESWAKYEAETGTIFLGAEGADLKGYGFFREVLEMKLE